VAVAVVRAGLTWSSGGTIGCTGGPPESAVVDMSAGATGMSGGGSGFVSISGKGSGTVGIIGTTPAGASAGANACVWHRPTSGQRRGLKLRVAFAYDADGGVGGRTAVGGGHAPSPSAVKKREVLVDGHVAGHKEVRTMSIAIARLF